MKDHVNKTGYLEVGGGHTIYWEDWGNPDGYPIFSIHGGPGNGFNDSHKLLFDPTIHRVIFYDQRGCGKSTPFASTENNTTPMLIKDIEALRQELAIEKMYIMGGSWGSALSLLYSIAHPDRIKSLLIWGVYLIRELEDNWVNEGYPRYNFPEEWNRFISLVPEDKRNSGEDIMEYYAAMMRSENSTVAKKYAIEWTLWESALISLEYDPEEYEEDIVNDKTTLSIALLETHYFINHCFVSRGYILDNIKRISHIPATVVQGRFDMCTPPIAAYDLKQAYGKNLDFTWVNSGHLRTDPEMIRCLKTKILQNFR